MTLNPRWLENQTFLLAAAVKEGMTEDPGHSDLDDEQPINVHITLGDYRRAKRLFYDLVREDKKP